MIQDVKVKQLKPLADERGLLMEFLRDDDEIFQKFGQVYLTLVKRGTVKAWHFHNLQDDHFICVEGKALVALYDMRKDSSTYGQAQEFIMSAPDVEGEHILVKIPKGVAHGFTAVDCPQAKIVNVPTMHYNYQEPDEIRFAWNDPDINYKWPEEVKSGG
ncbi:MAG: dTDP-4-dehydrorhamnose 3,5-epimerase family protein [Patescibacteria group bacterium]|jgi:dTDP-4-dehydrorhamnose 3,5-epimerase